MLYHELLSDLHPTVNLKQSSKHWCTKAKSQRTRFSTRNPYLSQWIDESLSNIEATTWTNPTFQTGMPTISLSEDARTHRLGRAFGDG